MAKEIQSDQEAEAYYAEMARTLRGQGLTDSKIAVEIINDLVEQAEERGIRVIDMDSHLVSVNGETNSMRFSAKEDMFRYMVAFLNKIQ